MAAKSAMDARFNAGMISKINEIRQSKVGTLTKWNDILKILVVAKIAYSRHVKINELLVHPKNRGGLGLNAHNVHQTMQDVKTAGADTDHLRKATAFEMYPMGPEKEAQLEFNSRLITLADGLLAPMTGDEKLLTVACSHFSAGCRAAVHGCRTDVPDIKDQNGCINLAVLCDKDVTFKQIIEGGFAFTIVPWQVEQMWPDLPDLAQSALNVEHGTFSQTTELQVMASMAAAADAGVPWEDIIAAQQRAKVPSSSYLNILQTFVTDYAGGNGAPMIKFLDSFAKVYGKNKTLGSVFFEAVVDANFSSQATKFPFIRNACIAANLICPKDKVVEGFARLLVKSDIAAITRKDKLLNAMAGEQILSDAWAKLQADMTDCTRDELDSFNKFGALSSRVALFLTGKQKDGIEAKQIGKVWSTLTEISNAFDDELGGNVSAAPKASAPEVKGQASLEQVSDPQWIANRDGFVIGELYLLKGTKTVFKLDAMAATKVTFREQTLNPAGGEIKHVKFDELKKLFAKFTGKLHAKFDERIIAPYLDVDADQFKLDVFKSEIFQELINAAGVQQELARKHVSFYVNPAEVRCAEAIKANALKLIPITYMQNIVSTSLTSKTVVTGKGKQFYLEAPPKAKGTDVAEFAKGTMFAAYWHVATTEDEKEANMKYIKMKVDEFTFQILQNSKALQPFDKLVVFVLAQARKKQRT